MTTTKAYKQKPVATSNSIEFQVGALNALTNVITGKSVATVSLFTLPKGAKIHSWSIQQDASSVFDNPGSIGIGVVGTLEQYLVLPVPYVGTHAVKSAMLNTALAAETAVLGTLYASSGTSPGTLAVTCLFSI